MSKTLVISLCRPEDAKQVGIYFESAGVPVKAKTYTQKIEVVPLEDDAGALEELAETLKADALIQSWAWR